MEMERNKNKVKPMEKKQNKKLDRLEIIELRIKAHNEMYGTTFSYGTFKAAEAQGRLMPIPDISTLTKKR